MTKPCSFESSIKRSNQVGLPCRETTQIEYLVHLSRWWLQSDFQSANFSPGTVQTGTTSMCRFMCQLPQNSLNRCYFSRTGKSQKLCLGRAKPRKAKRVQTASKASQKDLKSVALTGVRVQVPLSAPFPNYVLDRFSRVSSSSLGRCYLCL